VGDDVTDTAQGDAIGLGDCDGHSRKTDRVAAGRRSRLGHLQLDASCTSREVVSAPQVLAARPRTSPAGHEIGVLDARIVIYFWSTFEQDGANRRRLPVREAVFGEWRGSAPGNGGDFPPR
jgi:hypothetical protein